jgi:hypothetical protein
MLGRSYLMHVAHTRMLGRSYLMYVAHTRMLGMMNWMMKQMMVYGSLL